MTESSARAIAAGLASALSSHGREEFADAAFTLACGQGAFPERGFVVARDGAEAGPMLAQAKTTRSLGARPHCALAFPGQGAQYVAMGRALAGSEPVFREHLHACFAIVDGLRAGGESRDGVDLRLVLDPPQGQWSQAEQALVQTSFTQPAIFAVEWALAQLWLSLGLRPEILIGHSVGEFTAACLAGVFTLPDALRLVSLRGRLMQSVAPGSMLSVRCRAEDIAADIRPPMGIAAINAPALCVVAGPDEAIAQLAAELDKRGVASSKLKTSHAFHSPMMDEIIPAFHKVVAGIDLRPPRLPIVSTVTGDILTGTQATDPAYWARHLRQTVLFSRALQRLWLELPDCIVIEAGPRSTLATLGRRIAVDAKRNVTVPSLDVGSTLVPEHDPDEEAAFLRAVGRVWTHGALIDWGRFYAGESRQRVVLPTHAFESQDGASADARGEEEERAAGGKEGR